MIKQYLLNTGYFVDNQYLSDYIDLIQKPFSFSNYIEAHHILPVSYYKYKYQCSSRKEAIKYAKVDPQNTKIKLSYADHCKAHWLLYNCTIDKLKEDMAIAFLYMINKKTNKSALLTGLTDQEYKELQEYRDKLINTSVSKYYSEEEKQFLIKNAPYMTLKDMSELLNRSVESIHQQLRLLGIKKYALTTKAERLAKHKEVTKKISIEVSNKLDKALSEQAKLYKITKSELIRQILRAKLKS